MMRRLKAEDSSFITGKTRVVGLLGYPVEHSRSPAMHNAAFQALALNYRYLPFAVTPVRLAEAVRGLRALGFAGANVTVPHKQRVMRSLDDVSPEAEAIGAVNTIVNRDGRLSGHNTDAEGFLRAFKEGTGVAVRGGGFLVVGAGGGGRAVVTALAMSGAKHICVVDRISTRASTLVRRVRPRFPSVEWSMRSLRELPPVSGMRAVIQCSPVGMQMGDPSPLPRGWVTPSIAVYDLVYNRPTALLLEAKRVGAPNAGGLGMLLHQGALAFELWTGRRAPIPVMKAALRLPSFK